MESLTRSPSTPPTVHDSARLGPGVLLAGDCRIAADCRIGPGAVLDAGDGVLSVEASVRIEAGAVVAAAVTIGQGAHLMPGTVVSRNVPPHAIVSGNPAQIVGYTSGPQTAAAAATSEAPTRSQGQHATSVTGVTYHRLPRILDLRGNLTVGEFERTIPFHARRYFLVFGVPNSEIRGEHAHRTCHQFLICVHGSCSVVVDDGASREEIRLDDPAIGLHLPPLTWGIQYKYTSDAVLLVFASELYDSGEYIREYAEFLSLTAHRRPADVAP